MQETILSVQEVSKCFKLYPRSSDRLREALSAGFLKYHKDFWALKDVNLEVKGGETVAILGGNGAGKTTLLQMMAGIFVPTTGCVKSHGRMGTILELGSNLEPEFTGRENIVLGAGLAGVTKQRLGALAKQIAGFAELGDFLDQPVKTYSSGMHLRLAFAIAIHLDFDILLIDEVLSVGDSYFRYKCLSKLSAYQKCGKALVFASHDAEIVKTLATKACVLDHGRMVYLGQPKEAVKKYQQGWLQQVQPPAVALIAGERGNFTRYGTQEAQIQSFQLLDENDRPKDRFGAMEKAVFRIRIQSNRPIGREWCCGVLIKNELGLGVCGANTWEEEIPLPQDKFEGVVQVEFSCRLPLKPGYYEVTVGLAALSPTMDASQIDLIEDIVRLQILEPLEGRRYCEKVTSWMVDMGTEISVRFAHPSEIVPKLVSNL